MPELMEKLSSLSEAASLIKDGTRLHIGGFSVHNHPMAFVYELIRKGIKGLTLVGHVSSNEVDILVGAGCVKRIEISYVGLEEFGLAPNFRRAVENGEIELVEYSEPVSFERFSCSARGQSFFPTHEMLGTDLPKYNPDIKEMVSPFDGRQCHIVPAADPVWVVIHAPMADKYGNVLFFENRQLPQNLDLTASQSSNNVIVTVEQVVSRERVMALSHLNVIPRFRTTAIVEAPYGAHPTSCMQIYDQDRDHLGMYAKAAGDPVEFRKYLDKYVYGVSSHMDYLKLIGAEALVKIRFVGGNL
ncbi:CoA transferase subunit A [Thermodesulfobacteriota bacterium]